MAVKMLSSSEDCLSLRGSSKFFEKVGLWRSVFEMRSQGISMTAVAKTLKITVKSAYTYYHRYVELKAEVIQSQLSSDQMKEISEYLLRLEHQREELAFEVATMGATEGGKPSVEEHMAKLATRRVLIDVEKQIADIKKGLGLWHSVPRGYFKAKEIERQDSEIEETRQNVRLLLEKAIKHGT